MAIDKSDLMKLPKEEVVSGFARMTASLRKSKEVARRKAEDVMEYAISGGASFGVGYWIGTTKGEHALSGTDPTEDLKIVGVDKDLLIGGALAVMGITGIGGKKASAAASSAGKGVLSYWAGSAGERMAIERATEEDSSI